MHDWRSRSGPAGVSEPREPSGSYPLLLPRAHSQNADWTRPPRAARTPAPGPGPGRRAGAVRGAAGLRLPLAPSACQPGVRVFVFTSKRNDTKGENESDEQTKEREGPGNKVVCCPQRLRGADGERKYLGNLCKSTASPRSYVIFQSVASLP